MKNQKINVEVSPAGEIVFQINNDFVRVHFDNIGMLDMDDELKIYAAETEADIDLTAKFYPEMKTQIRMRMIVSGFVLIMTLARVDADKIAVFYNRRLQKILETATDRDGNLSPVRLSTESVESVEYPFHFHTFQGD